MNVSFDFGQDVTVKLSRYEAEELYNEIVYALVVGRREPKAFEFCMQVNSLLRQRDHLSKVVVDDLGGWA